MKINLRLIKIFHRESIHEINKSSLFRLFLLDPSPRLLIPFLYLGRNVTRYLVAIFFNHYTLKKISYPIFSNSIELATTAIYHFLKGKTS